MINLVELKPKQMLFLELIIIFIVTCFSSIGLFLRTNLFAYDSYAFLSYARGFTSSFGFEHQLFYWIIDFLPKDLIFYDFLMFVSLFLGLCALYWGLRAVYGKVVSMLTLLVLLGASPLLIFSFAQFQNEVLAYPLIFLSFCFLMRKNLVVSVIFGLLACLFWVGSLVWVGIILFPLFLRFWFKHPLVGSLFFVGGIWVAFLPKIFSVWFGKFMNIPGISFNTWFWGLFDFFLLFPFIFVVFKQDNKDWWGWLGLGLVFTCLSARFSILCLPFIALGIGFALSKWILPRISIKNMLVVCVFFILCWNIALLLQHPTQKEMFLVNDFVTNCKKQQTPCLNDWSLGWWVTSQGGITKYKSSLPDPDYNASQRPFLALTSKNLDCNLLNSQGIVNYYNCQ